MENTLISDALREGMEKGIQEGRQKGIKEGRQKGMQEGIKEGIKQNGIQNARGMKAEGIPVGIIAKITGLTLDEIARL